STLACERSSTTLMYSSRAFHGSLTKPLASFSNRPTKVSRNQSSALRSGARHCCVHSGCPPELHPQLDFHLSTPCTQLHELFSKISTSCVGGFSSRNSP